MSAFLLTAIFGTGMQPSIASENTRKSFIRTFGMLVRKPTSNWKVSDKKQTNKQTKPNAN